MCNSMRTETFKFNSISFNLQHPTTSTSFSSTMSKHKIDLHDIFNKGDQIDRALQEAMEFCVDRRIDMLEIIPGKGSGQLKKKVLRFLQLPDVKRMYHRIDKDRDNFGRLFVRFRH